MAPNKSSKRPISTRNGLVAVKLKKPLRRRFNLSRSTLNKMVCKEVKKQLHKILNSVNSLAELDSTSGSLPNQAEPSVLRRLHLHFVSKLPVKLFTASTVYAIAGETQANTTLPVTVVLFDENNNVVNEGPLSSLKVEIFVACGNVKAEELEASVVVARPQIGSLLVGNCKRTMENGVCSFNDLKFVDNSSWTPSKMFKLVAKVAQSPQLPSTVEIQQGLTNPFRVKDQRGKSNEKHLIPSIDDEVRHLEKIGAKYNEKLKAARILTVKDFLRKYHMDESSLKRVLGVKDGIWKSIVEHATKCVPNGEYFCYFSEDQGQTGVELLFNCFYKLIGVTFDHQNYQSLETLTENDKWRIEQVKRCAFEPEFKLSQTSYPLNWPTQQDQAVQDKEVTLDNIQFYPQSPLLQDYDEEEQSIARMEDNIESYPQSPLLQYHNQEEQSIAGRKDICSILRSNTLLHDTLMIDNENHPLYMQEYSLFDGQCSNWRPAVSRPSRVWYRARFAVLWFCCNKKRMVAAGS